MNIAGKYGKTMRRRYFFRAVWLPGTDKAGEAVVMRLFRIKRDAGIY